MTPDVVIGLDASTTACKAIAWDTEGRQLALGRAPLDLITPGPDLYEQDANAWWQTACAALREVTAQVPGERLAGLAIAHQRETFVLVDRQGKPLHNAILWLDERSRPYLDDLGNRLGRDAFHKRTGKPLSGNLAPGKLAWLREHQPDLLDRAFRLLDTHAFLVHHLTGQWATSTASADPLGLFDMQNGQWDFTGLDLFDLTTDLLPPVFPPGTRLGAVQPSAAQQTGLPVNLPVFAGIGDGQAAALGCGITRPGAASLSLGTSVISGSFAPAYLTHPAFRTMTGGLPGSCVLETVLLGGAYTLQWFTTQFLDSRWDPAELEQKAAGLPPGADGLLLVPYWNTAMGPYWDAKASGILVGWKGIHRPEHVYRAILEGIGFEVRLQLEQVVTALNTPLTRLTASGGGARSQVWMQILADITDIPVERSMAQEAASLGAAMLAAGSAGLHAGIEMAAAAMRPGLGPAFTPDPVVNRRYTSLYNEAYKPLFPALRPALHRLSDLSAG